MTNKKIWLTILAVMLIVCMLCSFVGCKKTDDTKTTPTPTKVAKTDGEKAVEQLLDGIENAINEQNLQDLKAGADIDFEVKYGDKTTTYNLAFNIELDLVQNGETNPSYGTRLEGEITDENGKVVLGIYYYDSDEITDVYTGNAVYLRTADKCMYFDAPSVAGAMKALAAGVNFTDSADISEPMSSASSVVDILKSYLTNATYSDNGSTVSVKLEDIVDGLTGLISGVDISAYTTPLNVDLTLNQVIEAIKSLTIKVTTRVDNGVLTGVDLSLGLDAFNLTAKKLNSTDNLLVVKLDKNTTVSISADFKVGAFISHTFSNNFNDATYEENLINAQASFDFYVSEDINVILTENKDKGTSLGLQLKAGYYTASLKVAANPFKVLSVLKKDGKWDIAFVDTFTEDKTATDIKYTSTKDNKEHYYYIDKYDAVKSTDVDENNLSNYYIIKDGKYVSAKDTTYSKSETYYTHSYVVAKGTTFNSSTTYYKKTAQLDNIIDAASKIIPIISDLQINLTQTKDASGNAVSITSDASTSATYLTAEVVKNYATANKETEAGSYVYLNMNLISGLKLDLSNGMNLTSLLKQIPDVISSFTSGTDESLVETTTSNADDSGMSEQLSNTLKTIGGYLLGAYIGVNDGDTGHGAIYASFDSSKTTNKKIPFSGYTEFKGEYNSDYTYYVDKYTVVATDAAKEADFSTYYTEKDGKYTKADSVTGAKFDASTTYYTHSYVGAGNITAFASGTQYYVGPEYGVGLKATLNTDNLSTAVTSTSGLITATIDGLDFIKGMPKSLTVSIGNIHASLFDFTPNYAVGGKVQTATASTK
jgi:hypothetical protein